MKTIIRWIVLERWPGGWEAGLLCRTRKVARGVAKWSMWPTRVRKIELEVPR